MKSAVQYLLMMILIVTVLFSSVASGFSLTFQPKTNSSSGLSQGLQVWFNGSPQLTTQYPTFYEFNVAAETSSGLWITNLHWDFGDGSTLDVPFSAQSYVSDVRYHAYAQPGTYTISVTAYDNSGNSNSAQEQVTWSDPFHLPFLTVSNAVVQQGTTSLQLPAGEQLYLYGFVTGGAYSSTPFSNGQYASVTNVDGNLVAALAATTSNSNSFTTQTMYYSIGGAAVSGFSSYTQSYTTDSTPASSGVSDHFSVSESGSLVVVLALGGDEQCLNVVGLSGFTVDASNTGSAGQPNAITIGHTVLDAGSYSVSEQTQQCAAGQDPNHAGNLIGVFVFQPGQSASTAPTITSVSPITASNNQTITITGSGFGTSPQTVGLSDGSVDIYACNVNTPSLAIWDNGGGSHNWAAGRQDCSNTDAIGVYLQSWSDTQIVLGGFGSALSTSGPATWNIAAGDSLVIDVWGPNENGSAQYSTVVVASMNQTAWQEYVGQNPPQRAGCFVLTYPNKVWESSQCTTAPPRFYFPSFPVQPSAVGGLPFSDDAAQSSGPLVGETQASFPSINPHTSETGICPIGALLCSSQSAFLGSDAYSLQINTNPFLNPGVGLAWEQFYYDSAGDIGIQYWVIGPAAVAGKCPTTTPLGSTGSQPTVTNWKSVLGAGCVVQTLVTSSSQTGEPVPPEPASSLSALHLFGYANYPNSGLDQVTLCVTGKPSCWDSSASDQILNLSQYWQNSEFNVFGAGGGSEAQFNPGTSITVSSSLYDQSGNPITVSCMSKILTTGETNNLNLGACSNMAQNQIAFTESFQIPGEAITSTSVNCSPPGGVLPGVPATCGAEVTGYSTSGSSSLGTITFSSSGSTGTFSPSSTCSINSNVVGSNAVGCSVSYSDTTPGLYTITASYSGNIDNEGSSSKNTVLILQPETQTLTTTSAPSPPITGVVNPDCATGCSEMVGHSVTVNAPSVVVVTPVHWQFSSWNIVGASCQANTSSNDCDFTMPNNPVTVTANYVPVGTNLQVKVSSQTTGAAVIGATVTMTGVPSGAQPYLMGTTDSSGEYTFQNVLAGGYVVSVSAQGYQTNTGSGTAPMGGTGVITVTLAQSPTYTVIFEESGLPNTEPYLVWSVTLNGQTEPSLNYPGNTNAEITFSNLQSDTYQFTIEPPQGYSASSPSGPVTVGSSTCTMTVGGSPPACVETITFTPSGQTTVNGEAPSQTTISLGNSVDDVPVALTYDSSTGEVFVGTFSGGVFVISDTTNAIVATVATASVAGSAQSVSGIAYDSGNNEVFVTNPTSQTVSAISVDTNTVVATISVNGSPTGVTYDSGKGEVFVTVATSHGDGSAYVISDVTNSAIAQIPVGPDPVSAAYDSAKGEVFIANKASNTVSVVSDATNAVTETINVEGIPTAAVYDSGQSEIFVSNYQSGTLSVISDTTDTVVATVNVRAGPLGLAYDPSTGQIIVSNPYDSNLSLVSDSSLKVANILVSAGFSSNTMVYDSGQRELFVGAAGSEIVSVIPMSPA